MELPRPDSDPPGQLYLPRPDLVAKYPTYDDVKTLWRVPTLYRSIQQKNVEDRISERYPLILTSGRIVEFEGGGEETRSNPWLAELVQENYVEINPQAAADRGIRNRDYVWLRTPTGARLKVRARVIETVGPDTVFVMFHFSGWWQGTDLLPYYPDGAHPIVRGEAINTGWTYGYDAGPTMMQGIEDHELGQVARAYARTRAMARMKFRAIPSAASTATACHRLQERGNACAVGVNRRPW